MTQFLLPPGFRATDADDNPLAGGYYKFYAAGTTTPKAVYSDADLSTSLGTQVNLNSAGAPVSGANTPVLIYLATGDYKVELYDSDDTPLFTFDDVPGKDEEAEAVTTAIPTTPVISKSSAYTVTSAERGKLINANPTGGSFAITLPSAVTLGDNFVVGVRHNGSANQVSVVSSGSQFVRAHKVLRSYALVGMGETAWFVSDGSDWIVKGYHPPFPLKATAPYFRVLDRVTAPPANPDAGARYLINGTPTGSWNTLGFAENDIAEADGNGSWIRLTPETGWIAFDADEEQTLQFKDDAWENFQIDPGTSTLKTLIVRDQKSSGTAGGDPTTDSFTTAVLNTVEVNTIDGSSLASNTVTLPAGRYRVNGCKAFHDSKNTRIRFKTKDDDSIVIYGENVRIGHNQGGNPSENASTGAIATLFGEFEISETTDFILQYRVSAKSWTGDSNTLGYPMGASGIAETYATVVIEDLASLQGPQGTQGLQGSDGLDAAYWYQWSTSTSGDPGTGKVRTNHATPASVTEIAVHQTDAAGADLATVIASWDDSTSAKKARVRWHKEGAPENFYEFRITGTGTDVGDYWTFPVEYIGHGGTIANGNDLAVIVVEIGEQGDPGTTVPDIGGLSAMSDLDHDADQLIVYDASALSHKKATPEFLGLPVTPEHSGAVGDDTADDSTAFQAALDDLPNGGTFKLTPGKTYRLESSLTITDKTVHIDARGAKIHFDADVEGLTAINGVTGLQSVSSISGATVTVTDGSYFARGDVVKIISEDAYADAEDDGGSTERRVGEIAVVKSVTGNDVELFGALFDENLFVTNTRIFKLNNNTFSIEGGEWYYTNGEAWDNTALRAIGYINPVFRDVRVTRAYGAAIGLGGTYNALIDGGEVRGLDDDGTVFGYGIADAGTGTRVIGFSGADCRHVTTTSMASVAVNSSDPEALHYHGRVVGGRVLACTGFGVNSTAFDTHHGTRDYRIDFCFAEKADLLLGLRGWNISAKGNTGRGLRVGAQIFTQTSRIATEAGYTKNVRIDDLDVECSEEVMTTSGGVQDLVLDGTLIGASQKHRALYFQNASVRSYANIEIDINDTDGASNADGALNVRDDGVSYDCGFLQRGGRILIDAEGDTGGTNKTGARAFGGATIDLINARFRLSTAYDVLFETASSGIVTAYGVTFAVLSGAESGVTVANGSNITVSVDSDDASNDVQGVPNVLNWRIGRRLRLPVAGLRLRDTDDSHDLTVSPGSNLSADRTLTLITGDADRSIDISAGNAVLADNTYTPTRTAVENVASSTFQTASYFRVNNKVFVRAVIGVTPTAGGGAMTQLGISLPIASDFSASSNCVGNAADVDGVYFGAVIGSSGSDRATLRFVSNTTSEVVFYIIFMYDVI